MIYCIGIHEKKTEYKKKVWSVDLNITILSYCFLLCLIIYLFNSQLFGANLDGEEPLKDANSLPVSVYLKNSP